MTKQITIDPITRIEGHSEIRIFLNDDDRVSDVQFAVKSFRGFERFLEGAPIEALPQYTARVCGICYTAHILASCKALENALEIRISEPAKKLRELLYMGNFIQSHTLSIAVLSLPDLIPGGTRETRNIQHLLADHRDLAEKSVKLSQLGLTLTRLAGKRAVHPVTPVIGGMLQPLQPGDRDVLERRLESAVDTVEALWQFVFSAFRSNPDLLDGGGIETAYLSLNGERGVEFYDGSQLAIADKSGEIVATVPPERYGDIMRQEEREFSYMKFPVLVNGARFRVGPLARLNVCKQYTTPRAQTMSEALLAEYRAPLHNSMFFHLARIIELMYTVERATELLQDDDLLSDRVKPDVYRAREAEGVGVLEAPRGTLVHIYDIDGEGFARKVQLNVATQHNNFAINAALKETAQRIVRQVPPPEAVLNELEMIVRAYDPCLSCATHVLGRPAVRVQFIRSNDGDAPRLDQ
ncbi:MAG: Ni/Fe hydrogenase subunit alpha [Anaerolineales bacterium]|nr:Ni/Fe hydrogenase subunit alpha [Anaerolineales bacterium]